jgi:hypothetical protein
MNRRVVAAAAMAVTVGLFTCAIGDGAPVHAARLAGTPKPASLPSLGGNAQLFDVSCVSATNCIAVGGRHSYTSGTIQAVIGKHVILRLSGGTWSNVTGTADKDSVLYGVDCPTAAFCMAVGAQYASGTAQPDVFVSTDNGQQWTQQSVGAGNGQVPSLKGVVFYSVSCRDTKTCVAVGARNANGGPNDTMQLAIAEYWNGTTWVDTSHKAVNSKAALLGVSCTHTSTSLKYCIAVGGTFSGKTPTKAVALRIKAPWKMWQVIANPSPYDSSSQHGAVLFGVSCIEGKVCVFGGADPTTVSGQTVNLIGGSNYGDPLYWKVLSAAASEPKADVVYGVGCQFGPCMAVGDISSVGQYAPGTTGDPWNPKYTNMIDCRTPV